MSERKNKRFQISNYFAEIYTILPRDGYTVWIWYGNSSDVSIAMDTDSFTEFTDALDRMEVIDHRNFRGRDVKYSDAVAFAGTFGAVRRRDIAAAV